MDVNSFVIHQLVGRCGAARLASSLSARRARGTFVGAIAALAEASSYQDVDGLVLTAISHFSPSGASSLQRWFKPIGIRALPGGSWTRTI